MTNTADRKVQQAVANFQQGQMSEAIASLKKTIAHQPDHFEANYFLGVMHGMTGHIEDAVVRLRRAVQIRPADAMARFNLAKALSDSGRHAEAIEHHHAATLAAPTYHHAWLNLAISLNALGKHAEALDAASRAVQLQPDSPDTWTTKGVALLKLNRHVEAASAQQKATTLDARNVLAWSNLASTLLLQRDYAQAIDCADKAIHLQASHAEAWSTKGVCLEKLHRMDEAIACLSRAIELNPKDWAYWSQRGSAQAIRKQHAAAADDLANAFQLAVSSHQTMATCGGMEMYCRLMDCDWSKLPIGVNTIQTGVDNGMLYALPMHMMSTNMKEEHLFKAATLVAQKTAAYQEAYPSPKAGHTHLPEAGRKLRVGYFSSDWKTHPVGLLTHQLFKQHDRERFEVIGIFLTAPMPLDITRSIQNQFSQWIDISVMPFGDALKAVRALDLDIAIDLNGHTADNWAELFVCGVAPIQAAYLGYPGTTSIERMDYIIADQCVIPAGQESYFSEKVIRLPNSFFITQDPRETDPLTVPITVSRAAEGLPDDAFVFACFNQSYKIDPDTFDTWMNILQQTPNSVLWLAKMSELAMANLRKEAASRGVDPGRLKFAVFTESHAAHLKRLSLADLFVDCKNYNAHTTASEALMAGVPVVTCTGQSFAGRVASSLLHAVGLPELVTHNLHDYEKLAVDLCNDPKALSQLRTKLWGNRSSTPLFNTEMTTRHIERAYQIIWERHVQGLPPDHIEVLPA